MSVFLRRSVNSCCPASVQGVWRLQSACLDQAHSRSRAASSGVVGLGLG
jgi:hypothetical protein